MAYKINENCIGCGDCKTHCTSGAISLNQDGEKVFSSIDPDLCVSCGHCAHFCQHQAIVDGSGQIVLPLSEEERPVPYIKHYECTGCMICVEECPEYALSVIKLSTQDFVAALLHPERCLGCGHCAKSCPVKVITLLTRADYIAALSESIKSEKANAASKDS